MTMIDESSTSGKAVVIGAGTMGGGIAAQLANAGWHVQLLDVPSTDPDGSSARSVAAVAGLDRVMNARPPLLYLPEFASRIQPGNTADHLTGLQDADWVVEAVAERMDVKRSILAEVEANCNANTVITSNTSGLSLSEMAAGHSTSFRSRFLGSHFLNPPRYLKLLEVIPLPDTDPAIASAFVRFAEQVLGHRVVVAKDTPGFISTRIWIEHLIATMRLALAQGLTVEEADYLTGALLGRPRSGTFRMADLVGLDIVAAIAANQAIALRDVSFRFELQLPEIVERMIVEGRLGDKTGGGFYKRVGKEMLALDLVRGEYRPRQDVRIDEVEALLSRPLLERLRSFTGKPAEAWDTFVQAVLDSLTAYVDYVGPLVASDALSVDNVMRWGFQWEIGPYEMEDARTERQRNYRGAGPGRRMRVFGAAEMQSIPALPEFVSLADRKAAGGTVFETADGALVDLGDGVACLEFRTKLNTVSPRLCEVIDRGRALAEREFAALVIGAGALHFSAGYDLRLLLQAAQANDWNAIDGMLRVVQSTLLGLKYSTVPAVAAVRGYTLGAGCECALHCAAIHSGPELTMGLPEIKAGLVPGGGGIKELLMRAMEDRDSGAGALDQVERAFRQIAIWGTSTSAAEARKLGLLRESDGISRNADRLLYEAKMRALALVATGHRAPVARAVRLFGGRLLDRLRRIIEEEEHVWSGAFTEHDRLIAERIAGVMCGGDGEPRDMSEDDLLASEREALIALAHEPKSIARMQALLATGRPLKN